MIHSMEQAYLCVSIKMKTILELIGQYPAVLTQEERGYYLPDSYTIIPPTTLVRQNPPSAKECPSSDQPLYALAKQIQWSWPTTLGEEHYLL